VERTPWRNSSSARRRAGPTRSPAARRSSSLAGKLWLTCHLLLVLSSYPPSPAETPASSRKKIRNPNVEIRNKPEFSKPKVKNGNPKRVGLEICVFRSLGFVSNFGFRVSSFLFASHSLASLRLPFDLAQGGELVEPCGSHLFSDPEFLLLPWKLSDNETLCQPEPRLEVELDICLQPGLLAIVSPQFRPG